MGIKSQIDALRAQGYTLQEIADILGISRQAVNHYKPRSLGDYGYCGFYTASRLFSTSKMKLWDVCKRLGIEPRRTSGGKLLFSPDQVEELRRHFGNRRCRICGGRLPPGHWVYCSSACYREGQKHKYRPQWRREKHKALGRRKYQERRRNANA